jgi:hypothetical protein
MTHGLENLARRKQWTLYARHYDPALAPGQVFQPMGHQAIPEPAVPVAASKSQYVRLAGF